MSSPIPCAAAATSATPPDVEYYQGTYEPNHWALKPLTLQNPEVIAVATLKDKTVAIRIMPIDMRCARVIVALQNFQETHSTFNREYTPEEWMAVTTVMGLTQIVYGRIFPAAQMCIAGNNALSFNATTGITTKGIPKEPFMPHGHVWGIGNPDKEYVAGIRHGGPKPGIIFDMRGETPHQSGNEALVPWPSDQKEIFIAKMKSIFLEATELFNQFGVSINV